MRPRKAAAIGGALFTPWVRDIVRRYWLQTWFVALSAWGVVYAALHSSRLFFDARLYLMATQEWLSGGDPWSVDLAGNVFAAPPPTLLVLAPVAGLPLDVGVAVVAAAVIGAAVLTVRLLRLPWFWLLFPPLVQSVLSANVHALVLPLILVGAGPISAFLKVYALGPIIVLGRWRSLAMTSIALLVTVPILPWSQFIARFGDINARLVMQTDDALPTVVLIAAVPIVLIAMRLIGRERSAWLVVPAIWPSQQYYYASLAIGARDRIAAAIVAWPVPGSGLLAILFIAWLEARRRRHSDSSPDDGRTNGTATSAHRQIDSGHDRSR